MKKKLLLASAFISLCGTSVQAQNPVSENSKWDPAVDVLFQQDLNTNPSVKSTTASKDAGIIISCTSAEAVAEAILLAGYDATVINDNIVSATVPVSYVPVLADMEDVIYMNASKQFKATMNSTRKVTNVDEIHAGQGLETPFSGKGVIVGVIDQGFQYKHTAFLDKDGNSRVLAVWDHKNNQRPREGEDIPTTNDGIAEAGGHATHVTNIAAGSKTDHNDFYGIAYNADIIMIPSSFNSNEVLKEAKYISDFAEKEGKPYVINMSFGSQMGPHDGTDNYSHGMNSFSKPGGILVAAMGNEGEMKLHTTKKFKENNEKVRLVIRPLTGFPYGVIDLWEQTGDGKKHLKVTPFIYDSSRKRVDMKDYSFWRSCIQMKENVDANNDKHHFYTEINFNNLQRGNAKLYFGIEIEGNIDDEFHAWLNPGFGEIYKPAGSEYLRGDNEYCVGEGAASIPMAVSVASFDGNDGSFKSAVDNQIYSYKAKPGSISSFSSRGPSLGDELKPLISAPGHVVASAVSTSGLDIRSAEIVDIIKNGFKKDYYSVMSGTSMASPAAAGIIALWLEANPKLTFEQIKTIFKETAIRDSKIGTSNDWDAKSGFGKIDAYAGLKKALELAENTGINDQLNSETPITIQRNMNQFRILFNNDESYANISLYNASGVEVKREQLNNIRRGNETVLNAAGLPAGVYMVRIQTTASSVAKKMMVK